MKQEIKLEKKSIYTEEDYNVLPEGAPYQLIGGMLIMTPAPTPYHQKVLRNLAFALWQYVKEKGLGEVFFAPIDVYFDRWNIVQPDIVFIDKMRTNIINNQRINAYPDLTIEIISPSTAYYDLIDKKELYERYGVKEYWLVDPLKKKVEIYENKNNKLVLKHSLKEEGVVCSIVVKDFTIDLKAIFD